MNALIDSSTPDTETAGIAIDALFLRVEDVLEQGLLLFGGGTGLEAAEAIEIMGSQAALEVGAAYYFIDKRLGPGWELIEAGMIELDGRQFDFISVRSLLGEPCTFYFNFFHPITFEQREALHGPIGTWFRVLHPGT